MLRRQRGGARVPAIARRNGAAATVAIAEGCRLLKGASVPIEIYGPQEVEAIARAADIATTAQVAASDALRRGEDVREVDARTAALIRQLGGVPAYAGYKGFPNQAIIVSVDEQVTNAVARPRVLRPGEIASVSVAAIRDGMHAKAEAAFVMGRLARGAQRQIDAAETALDRGVEAATVGNRVGDISSAIGESARGSGFSVVTAYCGHGIGRALHADPEVPGDGRPRMDPRLREGMVLYLMAMLVGGAPALEVLEDDWTVVTADGAPSATAAAMVAITQDGPRRLGSPTEAVLPVLAQGWPRRGWLARLLGR
jgi:methionyl aminopeptidase